MKASNVFAALLLILEIGSVALFLVCGQTVFSLLGTATGGGEIPILINNEAQVATLTFTFAPRNGGLLAANVAVGFGVTLTDGSYSVKNTTTVYLPPGTGEEVSLSIKVPLDKLQEYADAKGTLDIYTSIRTLNDIVRLDYNAKTEGGG